MLDPYDGSLVCASMQTAYPFGVCAICAGLECVCELSNTTPLSVDCNALSCKYITFFGQDPNRAPVSDRPVKICKHFERQNPVVPDEYNTGVAGNSKSAQANSPSARFGPWALEAMQRL